MLQHILLIFRTVILTLHIVLGLLLGAALAIQEKLPGKPPARSHTAQWWLKGLCRILGIRIQLDGTPEPGTTMLVSNHISWLDIPVIGSLKPVHFLSKSEVREWPVIGWLADKAGTFFIKRGGGKAGEVGEQLKQCLAQGQSTLFFPEGTTTVGTTVRKFHGRLLKSGIEAGVPLQPITLCYIREAEPDRIAAYIDDDDFVTHLFTVMRQPNTTVHVICHPPIPMQDGTVADLSRKAEHHIRSSLHGLIDTHCGISSVRMDQTEETTRLP